MPTSAIKEVTLEACPQAADASGASLWHGTDLPYLSLAVTSLDLMAGAEKKIIGPLTEIPHISHTNQQPIQIRFRRILTESRQ